MLDFIMSIVLKWVESVEFVYIGVSLKEFGFVLLDRVCKLWIF